ncbi:hypothetical protein BDQ17DRAFT_1341304 [Cyathus striatus]|nr:hypothetical protein BDQ17DRAFT_1341304 [Cyathus striatus]
MTAAQSKHRAVIPSPLSQSASAVHLQVADAQNARFPRKLSKRKTPAVNHIFGNDAVDLTGKVVSAPVSPICAGHYEPDLTSLPKRMSVAPPLDNCSLAQSAGVSSKKEKRSSMLGRLVKKFSIMRKGGDNGKVDARDSWQHVAPHDPEHHANLSALGIRSHSSEKNALDLTRRVPPPSMGETGQPHSYEGPVSEMNRLSLVSVNPHISIGKLTIANPDTPDSERCASPDHPPPPPEKMMGTSLHDFKGGDAVRQLSMSHISGDNSALPLPEMSSPPPISLYLAPLVSIAQTPPTQEQRPLPPEKPKSPTTSGQSIRNGPKHISSPYVALDEAQVIRSLVSELRTAVDDRGAGSPTVSARTTHAANEQHSHQRGQSTHVFPSVPMQSELPSGSLLPIPTERLPALALYNDSPLSAASVLANPPTPYDARLSIPGTPESVPPPLPSKMERKSSSRDSSAADKTMGRQTETFKLIRSASGNVYASSETIVAAGQQWEVVESVEGKAKRRPMSSKSKDKEGNPRKEPKEKAEAPDKTRKEAEVDEHHRRSRTHRSSKQPEEPSSPAKSRSAPRDERREAPKREDRGIPHTGEKDNLTGRHSAPRKRNDPDEERRHARRRADKEEEYTSRRPNHRESDKEKWKEDRDRENVNDHRKRSEHPENRKKDDVKGSKSTRKQDGRDRGKESRAEHSSSHRTHSQPTQLQSQTTASTLVSQIAVAQLERHPSTSARPTSELPSAADMNAMRAKEAWEMERLWKARSMHGMDPNGNPSSFIPPSGSSVNSDNATSTGAVYGSSHTAFVVQGPFQGHPPYFYHSIPGPSPHMYPSPSSVPSIHGSTSSYDPIKDKADPWPPSTHNPLPEPPRESPYTPAILPSIQRPNGRSAEHWTTYNGVTTAH